MSTTFCYDYNEFKWKCKVQKGDGAKEVQCTKDEKNPVAIMKIYDPVMFL